ncbi:MAG: response regulator [Desulfobacteraceae bacterium]|nr:response regulator [Desulfobacteraceae bacterium]
MNLSEKHKVRWDLILWAGAVLTHAILFVPTYARVGNPATALTMLPIAASAFAMGWCGGLLAALVYLPINAGLLYLAGAPVWAVPQQMWPGILGSFVVGAILGALSDSSRRSRLRAAELKLQKEVLEREIEAHKKTRHELCATNVRLKLEVSERRRVSDSLAHVQADRRDIFENVEEGLFQANRDGFLIAANPAAARLLAFDSVPDLIYAAAEASKKGSAAPDQLSEILLLARKGEDLRGHEIKVFRSDGTLGWIQVDLRAVPDANGNEVQIRGRIRDVTERKVFEAERADLESLLNKAQRLETIGTLAGGIAHDFNNVLAIIMGYADLVRADLPDNSREKQNIERALQACNRAMDLVRQILAFCRSSNDLERSPFDVRPTIEEVLDYFRSTCKPAIEIRQNLSEEAATVLGNPSQIHQVVTNLCTNAIHAMETAGGVLAVELAEASPSEYSAAMRATGKPGPFVRLTVKDTGHGMDPATMERIFEPYFTTKGPNKGNGIGLAVVQGIVKGHDGTITVESQVGKGTSFHIFLQGIEAPPMGALFDAMPKGSERVLLVDAEPPLADIWKNSLARLGYNVVATSNGLEALEIFRVGPYFFDLVVADNSMPQISGVQLAEKISKIRPDIPIILCTDIKEDIPDEKIRESGVRMLMRKPLEWGTVANVMRQILDEARTSMN